MKRITIEVFNYKTAKNNYNYQLAISYPKMFHFVITNGAITFSSHGTGYKTKSAALSAAKARRKHLKALGMI